MNIQAINSPSALLREFMATESAGGILLVLAAMAAILAANSPVSHWYDALLHTPVALQIGTFQIDKPLLLWINDGLMAVFFFLVGLEIKREVVGGELSSLRAVALPAAAAVGGMAIPAALYASINWGDPIAMKGWAIPAATDIAFALGVLALLGSRVPVALKVFLMSLAVLDDLGAIVVIAIFYTADLSVAAMSTAIAALVGLFIVNRRGVRQLAPYLLLGVVLWASVLKSGVHATLAGVLLALFIPSDNVGEETNSPLKRLEQDLHGTVAFIILPVFAFANAGVNFESITIATLLDPVPLGVAVGLFVGKQLGVFGFSWLAVKSGLAQMPADVSWFQIYGVSLLAGIGFTMSLFIGTLAFEQGGPNIPDERLGILLGSLLSAVVGYLVLRHACRQPVDSSERETTAG